MISKHRLFVVATIILIVVGLIVIGDISNAALADELIRGGPL